MVEACQRVESIESNLLVKINNVNIKNIQKNGQLILHTQKMREKRKLNKKNEFLLSNFKMKKEWKK